MQTSNIPIIDLVFIGGGHSHAIALKMFAMHPIPGLRITLISEYVDTPYSGMLPGLLAGDFSFEQCHIDLRRLCELSGVSFIQEKVVSIDPVNKAVQLSKRPSIHFDILSLNIGSTPDLSSLLSGSEYVLPVKPIAKFLPKIEQLDNKDIKQIVIVGAGAAGVELALSLENRFNRKSAKEIQFTLINAGDTILSGHNINVRKKVAKLLKNKNIKVINQNHVIDIQVRENKKYLILRNNTNDQEAQLIEEGFDEVIWATHASAAPWLKSTGLPLNIAGFIKINNNLQTLSDENIFATGDISSIENHERAKSGVFAVRQGMPLYENIRRFIFKRQLKPYYPQQHFLSLLNCGDFYAIASWRNIAISGKWLWYVKRWIDQRFMAQFSEFKGMPLSTKEKFNQENLQYQQIADRETFHQIEKVSERCGGCGAKVSGSLLNRVLTKIKKNDVDDIVAIQKDDAAIFTIPEKHQIVQSIDYFRSFIDDPYLLGQIATIHALSDLYAMGAKPHSAQVLIGLPFMAKKQQEETLYQLMSGIVNKLKEEKVKLIGGHTNEAAEMGCGLTVNGTIKSDQVLEKGALKKGQFLILTKPLGTGIILAANMQAKARGEWVEECIQTMLQSSKKASEIINQYKVKACTDITGFGLVGHLSEMLSASKCQAKLALKKIPYLNGVQECLEQGIVSSLYEDNLSYQSIIELETEDLSKYPVLFDPQTAGGLLFACDSEQAEELVNSLIAEGYEQTSIIGQVTHDKVKEIKLLVQ